MKLASQVRADWRALGSAALIGSGIGLGLGATYMAGGMANAVVDHNRNERIAAAAAGGFSESVLQREASGMDPGAIRLARSHDPLAQDDAPVAALPLTAAARRMGSKLDSARELDCLTSAVYFEARGETPRGQAAVAQVVLNRVKSPAFPKTVCGVVFQGATARGCQFSFACDGSMRHGREADAWDRARLIAARALSGVVLADIGSATHFHTIDVSPAWDPQMLRVARVGLHVFYRFNPHAPVAPPQSDDRAVFVSLPMQAVTAPGGLRLATAMVAKAADATVAASGLASQPQPAPAESKSAPGPLKQIDASAAVGNPSDAAANVSKAGDSAAN